MSLIDIEQTLWLRYDTFCTVTHKRADTAAAEPQSHEMMKPSLNFYKHTHTHFTFHPNTLIKRLLVRLSFNSELK